MVTYEQIITRGAPEWLRLREVLKAHSFKTGNFVLASGKTSTYYLDCRTTSLHPEGATLIGSLFFEAIVRLEAETGVVVAGAGGMTLGADPLAAAVAVTSFMRGRPLPAFIVRKEEKSHGRGGLVVGIENIQQGSPVVLLEDVVTTGGSTLQAFDRVVEAGLNPVAVLAIVDRREGGAEALAERNLPFFPLLTKDDFFTE